MEKEAEGCNTRDEDFDLLEPDAKDEDSLGIFSSEEDTLDKDTGLKSRAYCH